VLAEDAMEVGDALLQLFIESRGVDPAQHLGVVLQHFRRQPAGVIPALQQIRPGDQVLYPADLFLDLAAVVDDPRPPGTTCLCRGHNRVEKLVHAEILVAHRLDDGGAQKVGQLLGVENTALGARRVAHIEGQHERHAQLHDLHSQVQVPLQVGRVDDVDDDVGPLIYDEVPGHHLFRGVGSEAVGAGQIDDAHAHLTVPTGTLLPLHGDSSVIAHMLAPARKVAEHGGLAGIRVPRQGDDDPMGLPTPIPLPQLGR